MFPHPCGDDFADAVNNGADPTTVVPDGYVVAHGGTGPIPPPGTKFSGTAGPTLEAAAAALPHGQLRATTAGAIRARGGTVEWEPDVSRDATVNRQHVNIIEGGPTDFSAPQANPVPRKLRIDGDKKSKGGGAGAGGQSP
jgi:hypothetical protein